MTNHAPRSLYVGLKHHVKLLAPDVVHVTLVDHIEPDDMLTLYDFIEDAAQGGEILLVADFSKAFEPRATTRRVAVEDPRSRYIAARAILGASFRVRVVVDLMYKASCFFHGRERRMAFFDDETLALDWLKSLRPQLHRHRGGMQAAAL